jgi:hypothetical protein
MSSLPCRHIATCFASTPFVFTARRTIGFPPKVQNFVATGAVHAPGLCPVSSQHRTLRRRICSDLAFHLPTRVQRGFFSIEEDVRGTHSIMRVQRVSFREHHAGNLGIWPELMRETESAKQWDRFSSLWIRSRPVAPNAISREFFQSIISRPTRVAPSIAPISHSRTLRSPN